MIVIVPPDPAWVGRFAAERARIDSALGAAALRIDHIGSTSVPGLAAKPVVDIQVSVEVVGDLDAYRDPIESLGHRLLWDERVIGHVCFAEPDRDRRLFNVHVCQADSSWERSQLLFRDWLRVHPAESAAYLEVKMRLAARYEQTEVDAYADAKSEWIGPAMTRGEAWATSTAWRLPPADA